MMLKRQVIKNTAAVTALFAYAAGSVICALSFNGGGNEEFRDILGFFFWQENGALGLLNSFAWIAAVFFLGLSLPGFVAILPVIYCKMYSVGVSASAAVLMKGGDSFVFMSAFLPEVLLLFLIFTELGEGAISFSLYILQRLSLFPRRREQLLLPEERITFKEYVSGGAVAFFLATLLSVYENTVLVLFC